MRESGNAESAPTFYRASTDSVGLRSQWNYRARSLATIGQLRRSVTSHGFFSRPHVALEAPFIDHLSVKAPVGPDPESR